MGSDSEAKRRREFVSWRTNQNVDTQNSQFRPQHVSTQKYFSLDADDESANDECADDDRTLSGLDIDLDSSNGLKN